jgi:hypothetical protein
MVVRVQVGVVEGNRFAENAREWSPRGAKIKTVFKFRSTGIFGRKHLYVLTLLFGPAFFLFRPHLSSQCTLNKILYILIIPGTLPGLGTDSSTVIKGLWFLTITVLLYSI